MKLAHKLVIERSIHVYGSIHHYRIFCLLQAWDKMITKIGDQKDEGGAAPALSAANADTNPPICDATTTQPPTKASTAKTTSAGSSVSLLGAGSLLIAIVVKSIVE